VDAECELSLVEISAELRKDLGVLRIGLQVLLSEEFSLSFDCRDECFVSNLLPSLLQISFSEILKVIDFIFDPWSIWSH